jgi:predicted Rossmann fold nucleotide-binding protein DprA/Smf involved in DNA uptake
MNKIGIVGSRRRDTTADLEACRKVFLSIYEKGDTLVSGGCPKGGDKFAQIFAKEYNIPINIHYPDKSKLDPEKMKSNPKWAYAEINYARNTLIAQDSDILIAVVASDRKGGTEDTLKKATKMNKTIVLVPEADLEDLEDLEDTKKSLDDFDPFSI